MDVFVLIALAIASTGILLVKEKHRRTFTAFLHTVLTIITLYWCWESAGSFKPYTLSLPFAFWGTPSTFVIDRLAIFFIVLVNLVVMVGFVYSKAYLKPYEKSMPKQQLSVHYLAFFWLHLSMVLVPMAREGLLFILIWELMSISSFLLVIFEGGLYSTLRAGINYLIQMHIGMVFILIGFLIAYKSTGVFGFDGIHDYLTGKNNFWLFLLFFIGFGFKAGFIPLHTWLPEAHPAAPSHVSGIMSGIMIKMGIYGILRVCTQLTDNFMAIGLFLLVISIISAIIGLLFAIIQKDLKRVLAFSSIENIGIIGIGISLGLIGIALKNNILALFGFSGALLHIINHAVLKSLLFFSAGSVYQASHTRNIEYLGGLIKKMPYTTGLFLFGIIGLSGLPPLNGFISEYIIYLGMFKSMPDANLFISVLMLSSIIFLTFIGGLAFFCFARAFGIAFLGEQRNKDLPEIGECGKSMRNSMIFLAIIALSIGIFPLLFVKTMCKTSGIIFNLEYTEIYRGHLLENLETIGKFGTVFLLVISGLLYLKFRRQKFVSTASHVTWGCGYTNSNPKHQYTGHSFADNLAWLAKPILGIRKNDKIFDETEIFPKPKSYSSSSQDFVKNKVIDPLIKNSGKKMRSMAIFQTGQLQHYILYAFAFIMAIFILTYFNLI